jgi:hypothetical protein
VFTSERGAPFSTAGFARMIERAGIEAKPRLQGTPPHAASCLRLHLGEQRARYPRGLQGPCGPTAPLTLLSRRTSPSPDDARRGLRDEGLGCSTPSLRQQGAPYRPRYAERQWHPAASHGDQTRRHQAPSGSPASGVNAGSNVPKCAEVKILSWAGFVGDQPAGW